MSINFNAGKPLGLPATPSNVGAAPPAPPPEPPKFARLTDVLAAVEGSGDPKNKDNIISQEELHNYILSAKNDPTKNNTLVFKTAERLEELSIQKIDEFISGNNNQRLDQGDQTSYDFWMGYSTLKKPL